MALSLGQVALSLAGGAAKQINRDVDAASALQAKMRARAAELKEAQKLRIEETDYVNRQKTWDTEQGHVKAIGNLKSSEAKQEYIMFNILGMDREAVAHRARTGQKISPASWSPTMTERPASITKNAKDTQREAGTFQSLKRMFGFEDDAPEPEEVSLSSTEPSGVKVPLSFGGDDVDMSYLGTEFKTEIKADGTVFSTEALGADVTVERVKVEGVEPAPTPPKDAIIRLQGHRRDLEAKLESGEGDSELLQQEINEVSAQIRGTENKLKEATRLLVNDRGVPMQAIFDPVAGNFLDDKGKIVDMSKWRPVTDEFQAKRALKTIDRLDVLNGQNTAIGNVRQGLDDYKIVISEGVKGVTGAILDVGTFLSATVVGFGELVGVEPITTADREALFTEAGIDIDQWIQGDQSALRGMSKNDAMLLGYNLAGVLKTASRQDRTNAQDVKNAFAMVGRLGSTDDGLGAVAALEDALNVKQAGNSQEVYQTVGVTPDIRTREGFRLLRTTLLSDTRKWNQAREEGRIEHSPSTGEVFLTYKSGVKRSLDQVIDIEGRNGQLRPQRARFR